MSLSMSLIKASLFPEHWSEACVYKCQICWSFDTTSRALFVEHLSGSHAKSPDEYEVGKS